MLACPNTCSFSSSFGTSLGRVLTVPSALFHLCRPSFVYSSSAQVPFSCFEKWATRGRVERTFQVFISYQICFLVVLLLVVVIIIIQTFLILSVSKGAGIFLVLFNSTLHLSCVLCSCVVLLSLQRRLKFMSRRVGCQGMEKIDEINLGSF